eukprot:CAMPEP_0173434656 /NCGR_PEP_ID=MMETSP1357-20121228/13170_1 /TAXON_ID=77926 /ORGANISM="Hemiselmis rufescens, Strain PCC563" /LENGTH=196 /DNA_ID=CAMNT_0014399539 /DNA_START=17 /DNA_END=607 /DNA_ORIENTATION=-
MNALAAARRLLPLSSSILRAPAASLGGILAGGAQVWAGALPAHHRGVGSVQGGHLRGNVLEAWNMREVDKMKATRNKQHFDDFQPGDSVAVRYVNPFNPKRLQTFSGICLEIRRPNTWGGSFTLRNHIEGYAVEQQFPLYSPLLKGIRKVAKPNKRPRRAKLFYLRDRAPRECTVSVNDKDLNWAPDTRTKEERGE